MKLKIICAILTVCLFAGTLFISGGQDTINVSDNETYTVLASCFPVYALTEAIIKDVPGLSLDLLTLPRTEGYSDYELSDWESSLMQSADMFICFGRGFESFDTGYLSDECILLTLLGNEQLLEYEDGSQANENPYVYLSAGGTKMLLAKIASAMKTVDPGFTDMYDRNLDTALQLLDSIEALPIDSGIALCIEPMFAYMLSDTDYNVYYAASDVDIADLTENAVDLRGKMDIMLDMDESFSFADYVETLYSNYGLLYEVAE